MSGARWHAELIGRAGLLLSGARRRARLLRLSGTIELAGLLSLAVRYGRQRRLARLSGQAVLSRLAGTVQLTRLLLLSGPVLSGQAIWPLLAGLQLPDRTVRIDEGGIGAAEFALLEHELSADILRRMKLTHKALVAQHHRLRNRQRHGGETCTACAGSDGEAARALREKTEPRAGAVVDLDAADAAVGVVIFMSPVFATEAATKAAVPLATSNTPAFCLPPS